MNIQVYAEISPLMDLFFYRIAQDCIHVPKMGNKGAQNGKRRRRAGEIGNLKLLRAFQV